MKDAEKAPKKNKNERPKGHVIPAVHTSSGVRFGYTIGSKKE